MRATLAAIQIDGAPATPDDRVAEIDQRLREAAQRGARLAALPEMCLYGYELSDLHFRRAETVPGPSTDVLHTLARRHDLIVVAGLTEIADGEFYNTLVVVGPGGLLGRYRKMHVSAQENAFWKCAGEPAPIATDLGRIGLGICADMLHPTPWRHYRDAVDLVVICAAWPDLRNARPMPMPPRFRDAHLAVTREVPEKVSRLLGVPVVFSNACGALDTPLPISGHLHARFGARSRIVDGTTLVDDQDAAQPVVLTAEVELGVARRAVGSWDAAWLPHGNPLFRGVLTQSDRLLGVLHRPLYGWNRRTHADADA